MPLFSLLEVQENLSGAGLQPLGHAHRLLRPVRAVHDERGPEGAGAGAGDDVLRLQPGEQLAVG